MGLDRPEAVNKIYLITYSETHGACLLILTPV